MCSKLCDYIIVDFRLIVCFYKQKTAYEMRISDWSSDVCSSDLAEVSESLGRERSRDHSGHVDHPYSRQCIRHSRFLRTGATRFRLASGPRTSIGLKKKAARATRPATLPGDARTDSSTRNTGSTSGRERWCTYG